MLAEDFDKEDGIQLAIGGGKWYLFYADQKDFFEKHHLHEIRRMNGVLWWRNIGRLVFIKDVHAHVSFRNNKRADQRKSRVVAIK